MELWHYPALILGGLVCGIMNALAGGGSFVTLPLLLMIGLPPQVANATNRLSIALQCVTGLATYHRSQVRPWRGFWRPAIPLVVGALVGSYAAAHLDESKFRLVAAILLAAMLVTFFVDPARWKVRHTGGHIRLSLYPALFLIGIYGGFLQAGIGTVIITVLVVFSGYDVVRGNALKFAMTLVMTLAAILVFVRAFQIQWLPGIILAIGSMIGGSLGAKLVIARGTRWVRIFVILAALAAIADLLFGH